MNVAAMKSTPARMLIGKADFSQPALFVTGRESLSIHAGTRFAGGAFDENTPVRIDGVLEAGTDYAVLFSDGVASCAPLLAPPAIDDPAVLGGFHFAPGGNALSRKGGDATPAINPCSLWDVGFRPDCPDPRGMAFVADVRVPFWADIYLLGTDHLVNGTSKLGATIADGDSPPQNLPGANFEGLDYDTAVAVMKHHGKGLLSIEEFFTAAYGVTEKTSCKKDPGATQLDEARTSKYGLMQAAGNLWVWGHDGDPDEPRPSIFGGSWWRGGSAGSRRANVGLWAGDSAGNLGARGRSDHLQLV